MSRFSYDSPAMQALRRTADYLMLGFVWLISIVPILTVGAATAAAFRTTQSYIIKGEGRFLKTYFSYFRSEFRQGTILWLLAIPLYAAAVFYGYMIYKSSLPLSVTVLLGALLLLLFGWVQLWFGYLSRYNDQIRTILVNTLLIALGSLPKVLLLAALVLVLIAAGASLFYLISPLSFLVPALYLGLTRMVYHWIFVKYTPESGST